MQDARGQEQLDRREDSEIEVLRLAYADVREENRRLRDARGSLTAQLGPLPISAAIVAGLVSGFGATGKARLNEPLAISALCVFAVMVLVSVGYSRLTPYRRLRDKRKPKNGEAFATDSAPGRSAERSWYLEMIGLERCVRGDSSPAMERKSILSRLSDQLKALRPRRLGDAVRWLGWPPATETLQAGYDVEWRGVFITKLLFVVVVVLLILARVV